MGSSSQHYRGTARTFTEEWENVTTDHVTAGDDVPYRRSDPSRPPRNWSEMVEELGWTWELHVYVTAGLFSVLAVLCLFTVLRLRSQLSHSRNLTSLNVFLGILAASRLLVLYVDPYSSKWILPTVMLQVLWDLGYPCLVSAFCLLQLSVVREEAKVTPRVSESTASIMITSHFCLVITAGVLAALQQRFRTVWIVTQVIFVLWGLFLFLSTLLGCLRTLKSIVRPTLRFMTQQVDPGFDVNSIVALGMFTEEALEPQRQNHHPHHPQDDARLHHDHHPGIHITDVDEQTHSYASDASLAAAQQQQPLLLPQRSESVPMGRCLSPTSPTQVRSPDEKNNEDPAAIQPLIVSSLPEIHVLQSCQDRRHTLAGRPPNPARAPTTLFGFEPRSPKQSLSPSSPMPSMLAEDLQTDAGKVVPHRSRFEKNLRHLVFTSSLGVALCLLRAYDVGGLDGLLAHGNNGPLLLWFCLQTASRFVELSMAFSMVCGSQRSMNSRRRYYR